MLRVVTSEVIPGMLSPIPGCRQDGEDRFSALPGSGGLWGSERLPGQAEAAQSDLPSAV